MLLVCLLLRKYRLPQNNHCRAFYLWFSRFSLMFVHNWTLPEVKFAASFPPTLAKASPNKWTARWNTGARKDIVSCIRVWLATKTWKIAPQLSRTHVSDWQNYQCFQRAPRRRLFFSPRNCWVGIFAQQSTLWFFRLRRRTIGALMSVLFLECPISRGWRCSLRVKVVYPKISDYLLESNYSIHITASKLSI